MPLLERKLGDLATITTGLVIKRKQVDLHKKIAGTYKMLTLKSFEQNGWLNTNELESFESSEVLDEKYLTQPGDVIVRLSNPYTAIIIDNNDKGLLIPSLFVVVRVDSNEIEPEFLSIYLNSNQMKKYYGRSAIGSTIQIIKTGMLRDITLSYPSIENQESIIQINRLITREKKLLEQLLVEKSKYHDAILNKILLEGFKNDN